MITDLGIQQDIEKELRWDPGVNADHMAVNVRNRAVVLTGDVDSYWERCEAERAAWRVAHVQAVTNNLRVELPFDSERNDDDIALTAMTVLEWNCVVPASVEVQVAAGIATLSGTAVWQYQREEAERAVSMLTGLKGLRNQIQLAPAAAPADLRGPIEDAFKRSALVDSSHIKAHPAQSTVSLRGTAKTRAEQAEAIRAAWSAPGVTAVDNHIGIA
jgi:osmotically-inducible protein OsmY